MKARWIITLAVLALAIGAAAFMLFSPNPAQRALERTRRELRQQGFKIDLSEFDLSASGDLRARATALTNTDRITPGRTQEDYNRQMLLRQGSPNLMEAVGSNAVIVVWKREKLVPDLSANPWQSTLGDDLWPAMHKVMEEKRAELDAACAAALAGPIRFNLDASRGGAMLLPHLAMIKGLHQILGTRTVLDLRDGNRDAAWSNVLASARLVTAWEVEPAEVSQMVRFGCASLAYDTTWQALQVPGWTDEQLGTLQHEWESVEFFKDLPETAAFTRASAAANWQRERREPLPSGLGQRGTSSSPRNIWYALIDRWRRVGYRHRGSYEDERALLLHYRDRELELRRAAQCSTWMEMRQLPGVTNPVPFVSKQGSAAQSMLNSRQLGMAVQRGGQSFLGRAAEAEARRRLLITAVALERYRGQHGAYPERLQQLVPELLQQLPVDFMDGQPLGYLPTADGLFVLYSVGLDCVDNGGEMRRPQRRDRGFQPWGGNSDSYGGPAGRGWGTAQGMDLVWPRPASPEEVLAHEQGLEREKQSVKAAAEERWAEHERQREADRQAVVQKLLAEAAGFAAEPELLRSMKKDPLYQGRPLSQLLRNDRRAGTNSLSLGEMLTIRQVGTGSGSDRAVFEVPVSYDAATNFGYIHLLVDGGLDASFGGEGEERQTRERATNGNCLLTWTTTYDPPGKHAIQAEFVAIRKASATKVKRGGSRIAGYVARDPEQEEREVRVKGPAVAYLSTNVCQFSAEYDQFDARGATLYARLPESNGTYSIELTTPQGSHLKTLTGTTSNGVIKVHWDLIDDEGHRFTNTQFNSTFNVTLSDSGRSQKIKGP
jgi:hypothetical protein